MAFKTPSKTSEYLREVVKLPTDNILADILAHADSVMIPSLLPETAMFLYQMVAMQKPKNILEIGTGAGYSLHTMLYANLDAKVTTIDKNENNLAVAKMFLEKSGFANRVKVCLGDAKEELDKIDDKFDFVFLDGPKARYHEYLPYIKNMLTSKGILICDNMLFNGMVSGEVEVPPKKASLVRKIDSFLRQLCADPCFNTSILPVGDGVSLSIKND